MCYCDCISCSIVQKTRHNCLQLLNNYLYRGNEKDVRVVYNILPCVVQIMTCSLDHQFITQALEFLRYVAEKKPDTYMDILLGHKGLSAILYVSFIVDL